MSTAQTWIDRTRSRLLNGHVTDRNQLTANYTAGDTTLSFKYPLGAITKGARLSVGLNIFYVWDVGSNGTSATVSGGQEGSTDANAASGATVLVRPRFTDFEILTTLNEELAALSSPFNGLCQVKTFDLTYNTSIDGYDLTGISDLQAVYEVRYQEPGPYKDWPRIPSHHWRLDRSAFLSDFPSGNAIKIMQAGWPGYDIRVLYKAPYTTLTDSTTNLSTTGLHAQAWDIPPLGAAIRLMEGREIKRNFTESQPDTRRATEVPPGAVANSVRPLMIAYQGRIAQESARLEALYPSLTI